MANIAAPLATGLSTVSNLLPSPMEGLEKIKETLSKAHWFSVPKINDAGKMMKNAGKILLPGAVLLGISGVPAVSSGPVLYAACCVACGTTGPFMWACIMACTPVLVAPGP